jgi:hypothetical protein
VPTGIYVARGAYHGFDILAPDAAVSRQFIATILYALRAAFGLPNPAT